MKPTVCVVVCEGDGTWDQVVQPYSALGKAVAAARQMADERRAVGYAIREFVGQNILFEAIYNDNEDSVYVVERNVL